MNPITSTRRKNVKNSHISHFMSSVCPSSEVVYTHIFKYILSLSSVKANWKQWKTFQLNFYANNLALLSQRVFWGRIFSCVWPFYERAVSNQDRSMHRSLWVQVLQSSFVEGSHMTKNTASVSYTQWLKKSPLTNLKSLKNDPIADKLPITF